MSSSMQAALSSVYAILSVSFLAGWLSAVTLGSLSMLFFVRARHVEQVWWNISAEEMAEQMKWPRTCHIIV